MSTAVKLELPPEILANLRILVVAGTKSPQTGEDAIMAGAQILHLINAATAAKHSEADGRHAAGVANGRASEMPSPAA